MCADGFAKAPPDQVTHDGITDLLCDGEANAWLVLIAAVQNLDEKKSPASLFTATDCQEVFSLKKPFGATSIRSRPLELAFIRQVSRLWFRRIAACGRDCDEQRSRHDHPW